MFLVDFFASQGGSEGQLLQLIRFMDRSRYAPALTALRPTDYLRDNPPPCPVRRAGHPAAGQCSIVLRIARFALQMRREGYRIVHCYYNDTSLIAPPIMWLFGIRTIVSRRDMGFWQTPRTIKVSRRVAPFVSRYVANSLAVKRCVRGTRTRAGRKDLGDLQRTTSTTMTIMARPTATTCRLDTSRVPAGRRVIGIVANVKPIKRMDTLDRGFRADRASTPRYVVVIVGNDSPSPAAAARWRNCAHWPASWASAVA